MTMLPLKQIRRVLVNNGITLLYVGEYIDQKLSLLGWDVQFGMQVTSFVYGALMEACIRLEQVGQ